jgi:DNA-binding MurR/RpiR family transcriptional regulator
MQPQGIESAIDAIRSRFDSMSDAERKVAQYVLDEPKKAIHLNVAELSKQCGSSRAAVVRFCKRLGTEGFSDFKLRLARDVFKESDERFLPDLELESETAALEATRAVVEVTQRSLGRLATVLDPRLVDAAVDAFLAAPMIALFGAGASGIVASDFHQKLLRIGIPASFTEDTDTQITAACSLRPEDAAFVVSYSGENAAMIEAARQAKARGARVVSLTADGSNTLRGLADIALLVPASERIYRQGAETSRINQLVVVDVLYTVVISRRLDASIAAIDRSMEATHRRGRG